MCFNVARSDVIVLCIELVDCSEAPIGKLFTSFFLSSGDNKPAAVR